MTIAVAPEPVPLETDAEGVVCVCASRVTLDTLVAFHTGDSPEEIHEQYPTVDLADIYAVLTLLPAPHPRGRRLSRCSRPS